VTVDEYIKELFKKYNNIKRGNFDGSNKLCNSKDFIDKQHEVKNQETKHETQGSVDYINTARPKGGFGLSANKIPFSFKGSRKRKRGE